MRIPVTTPLLKLEENKNETTKIRIRTIVPHGPAYRNNFAWREGKKTQEVNRRCRLRPGPYVLRTAEKTPSTVRFLFHPTHTHKKRLLWYSIPYNEISHSVFHTGQKAYKVQTYIDGSCPIPHKNVTSHTHDTIHAGTTRNTRPYHTLPSNWSATRHGTVPLFP